ncbi:MAG TPA: MFS transporter [Steroidobacteraceae bacterium]
MSEATTEPDTAATRGWQARCAYIVMAAPNAAVGLTLAAMPPILPELAARLGGEHTAQLITSVSGFGMIAGGFFSGRLLERFGIRAFTLLSLVFYGLFGGIGWFLTSAWLMGASRFLLGVAGVCFSTAALALTAATFTGAARSRLIGLQQATSQVVNVCAVFIVGALVAVTGWRGAFLLYAAFALALLLAALAGVRSYPVPRSEEGAAAGARRGTDSVRFARIIAPACALAVLMGILTVIPMAQLPFVLADTGQGSPRLVSLVTGVNFVFAAVSAMSYAALKTRYGKRPVFFAGLCSGVLGIAAMGMVQGLVPFCIAAAFAGFGTGIYNTFVFDHGVEVSPPSHHARAAGLLFAFIFFGAAINPLVAAPFEQGFGLHHSLIVMAVVALLCGIPVLQRGRGPVPA